MLINPAQLPAAKYVYDPYGNPITMNGQLAHENLYRFSSKEWHPSSSLIHIGYRYLFSSMQRWLTHDMVTDVGFRNGSFGAKPSLEQLASEKPYIFCDNEPVAHIDPHGLQAIEAICRALAKKVGGMIRDVVDPPGLGGNLIVGPCMLVSVAEVIGESNRSGICIWRCLGPRYEDEHPKIDTVTTDQPKCGPCPPPGTPPLPTCPYNPQIDDRYE